MKIGTNKALMISVSLLLTLSSCGKSKDLKTDGATSPAPTAEPATKDKTPAQTAEKTPEPPKPTVQVPSPASTGPGNVTGTPEIFREGPFSGQQTNQQPGQVGNRNNLIPTTPESSMNENEVLPPLPASPFQNQGGQTNVINPPLNVVSETEGRAYQVDFTNQIAVKTGGQSKELFYTSAGRDGLMEEFKGYNTKVAKEQQVINQNLAKAVVTAKLTRQTSNGEVAITMSFDEGGTVKIYKVKAASEGDLMRLSLNRAATTGEMEFQGGFLKCLDLDGGCENAYAKMKFSGGYTRLIFRNSLSDMHFQYQENVRGNSGFDMFMNYITNSANSVSTSQTFDSLQMSSYEVVNGRAGMGALLTTNDKEMIGLSIPLVVSSQNSEVNAPVAKLNDLALNYDLSSQASSYSQRLSKQISNVNLTFNNGLGQLKLKLTLGTAPSAASIWLVASRVQKPTMSLQDVRTFESKVKNF